MNWCLMFGHKYKAKQGIYKCILCEDTQYTFVACINKNKLIVIKSIFFLSTITLVTILVSMFFK
jgi:hypothetical protein